MSDTNINMDSGDIPAPLSIFDLCETDVNAEENGKWFRNIEIGGAATNIGVKLRRFSSKVSRDARARLEKPYRAHQKKGDLPEKVLENILVAQMVDAIVVDWENILDRDGSPIAYSKEAAISLLSKLPHFRGTLVMLAAEMDNFRMSNKEEIAGNS